VRFLAGDPTEDRSVEPSVGVSRFTTRLIVVILAWSALGSACVPAGGVAQPATYALATTGPMRTCAAPPRDPSPSTLDAPGGRPAPSCTPSAIPDSAAFATTPASPHVGPKYDIPPTLMLHPSHEDFDAPEFLRQFLFASQARGMRTVTYSELQADPTLLARGSGGLLIITVDDVFLQAELDPSVEAMIEILLDAGAVAVLGVVTEGKVANADTAATLRDLAGRGWEIASHGDRRQDLYEIEHESPGHVRYDIRDSRRKLLASVGVEPSVLVLPYGQMVSDAALLYKEGIQWAVGISGGRVIDLTDRIIYVGRQPPEGSAEETLEIMLRGLGPNG